MKQGPNTAKYFAPAAGPFLLLKQKSAHWQLRPKCLHCRCRLFVSSIAGSVRFAIDAFLQAVTVKASSVRSFMFYGEIRYDV